MQSSYDKVKVYVYCILESTTSKVLSCISRGALGYLRMTLATNLALLQRGEEGGTRPTTAKTPCLARAELALAVDRNGHMWP